MAITQLTIEGFRSLKRVEWKPAPLNVLIGPNGSGKSNLLRALQMLRSAADGTLYDVVLAVGGMGALVWDSRLKAIAWSVTIEDSATYDITLNRLGAGAEYAITQESLTEGLTEIMQRQKNEVTLATTERDIKTHALEHTAALHAFRYDGDIDAFAQRLRGITVYHDLNVHQDAPMRQAAIARRETVLSNGGENLIAVLHTLYTTDREFKDTVHKAMRTAFGSEFEELVFPPAADQRVDMRIRWRSLRTEQSTANLSDGTLRFLMLVTILASPSRGELIAIDEPELGLHPNMLPIIAELAQQTCERTQVIFATHSPQFLDAFSEPPAATVVSLGRGESRLEMLSGKDLEAWLERYTLGELFRSGDLEAMV